MKLKKILTILPFLLGTIGLSGCAAAHRSGAPTAAQINNYYANPENRGTPVGTQSVFGGSGLSFNTGSLFSGGNSASGPGPVSTGEVGVNAYLWQAALQVLSFMPLASANPFGGVIITDWYQPPTVPNERFKVVAYILSGNLEANALRVTSFEQKLENGAWVSVALNPMVNVRIEDKILFEAQSLRAGTLAKAG